MYAFKVADLKVTLPNFPDEILEEWLLPYANHEGWPPAKDSYSVPDGRLRYLLCGLTLSELRDMKWQEENRHLSIHELHPEFQKICVDMVFGAVEGDVNLYSSSIKDLSERFHRIIKYLREHGSLPKAPALLSTPTGFKILDGNHRLSAYFYGFGYINLPIDGDLMDKTASAQRFWVGSIY